MYALLAQAKPRPRHEASGVPVGLKNEFDLKHYIDDLKCFETMFFSSFFSPPNRGGRGGGLTIFGKFQIFLFFLFLTPSLSGL